MDIEQEVIVKKPPHFAIQLDESIEMINCAILLCFVGYKEKTDFEEKLICCIALPDVPLSQKYLHLLTHTLVRKK